MKKTLALVLALAMVFSTITVAFAEDTLGADAQICADLGMLKGETGTVDAAYVATAPTRLQAAVMFLRLKGLEEEALAFTGEANFADGNINWAEGANLIAYLKANPQLGWVGDGKNFNPNAPITAKEYYKVLLETLGYKQTSAEVVGDFTWENVVEFAATVGLAKVADVESFTVNDLAVATVEALKVNVKDTEATLLATLVEAGKISEDAAVETGLMEGGSNGGTLSAEVDDAYSVGNAVVQVEFVDPVDADAAGDVANYSIEGLAINAVTYVPAARANGDDRVILDTAAQTAGKLYTLTVGDKTVQFSGLAKLSNGPEIETEDGVVAEDVEEVVIDFDRNVDYATGTDVANYTISGVTIVSAEVDRDEVTLTTEGLKDGQKYTVKCTNLKSADLVSRKTTSDDFKVDIDTAAPKLLSTKKIDGLDKEVPFADTSTRVIVYFNKEVDEETAEDLANYSIKVDETDGAALEIVSVEWDSDDEDNVEITTEGMDDRDDYKLTVSGIADQCKVPNVMTKSSSRTFEGKDDDTKDPQFVKTTVLSATKFMVEFKDDSRLDEESVLDTSNYEFECEDSALDIESITAYKNETGTFKALFTVEEMEQDGSCELTMVDIMDEYGNTMDEKTDKFTANRDNFTSAMVTKVEATGENTVIVYFDSTGKYPDVDEDSAENIANYEFDSGIGIPTDADYDDDLPYQVELTVNDLRCEDAYYCLTIDGLKDLAGNELKVVDFDVNLASGKDWSETVEVEGADATSNYVLSLDFGGEEIDYGTGASVTVTTAAKLADKTAANTWVLEAGRKAEDDTTIEFSHFTASAANVQLKDGVPYYVYSVYSITDADGDAITVEPFNEDLKFEGTDDEPEYAEFESVEQVDADTFKVIMSDYVKLNAAALGSNLMTKTNPNDATKPIQYGVVTAKDSHKNNVTFNVTVDSGDFIDETVFFQIASGSLTEDEEYTFNLHEFLVDELGIPAGDDDDVKLGTTDTAVDYNVPIAGESVFEGDDKDSDAPSIDDVVALDRWYIEVTFDENIDPEKVSKSSIELYDNDNSEKVGIAKVYVDDTFNSNILVIEVEKNDPLEARFEYEVRLKKGAVKDYNLNEVEADTFTFDGSDLAQH